MKKCSKCQCANDDEAKYCRQCGNVFSTLPWWKELDMIPVRDYKLKNSKPSRIFCYLLSIPCLLFVIGFVSFWSQIIFHGLVERSTRIVISPILGVLFGLIFMYFYFKNFSKYCFRNHLRKRRKELLDSDFIEAEKDTQYSIFSRGTKDRHMFGLFDNKKVKVILTPKYESLHRDENGNYLRATLQGKEYLVDLKGNTYEV